MILEQKLDDCTVKISHKHYSGQSANVLFPLNIPRLFSFHILYNNQTLPVMCIGLYSNITKIVSKAFKQFLLLIDFN